MAVKISLPHVTIRKSNQSFLYRRVVPPYLQGKIGVKNWFKTWPASTDMAKVTREAFALSLEHDRLILAAKAHLKGQEQQAGIEQAESRARDFLTGDPGDLAFFLTMLADTPEGAKVSPQIEAVRKAIMGGGSLPVDGPLLSDALAQNIELYGQDRDNKPYRLGVKTFIALHGDKPITAISRADVAAWIVAQGTLAPATIRRRLGPLSKLLKKAFLDLDIDAKNPFEDHEIKGSNGGADDRLPFNKPMLELIDNYVATGKRIAPDTKNILQIMRNTTGGPSEIGGVVLADMILDHEIPHIWIRPNAIRKRLKTKMRDRQIPLIGLSLEAARDALTRAMERTKGESPDTAKVFADYGRNGKGADSISEKLNIVVTSAGIPKSKRLVAYSYRHTLAEAMRSAAIPQHIHDRIMGHSGGRIADRYGSPRARLSEARDAIEKAMKHLGSVDDSIYSENERLPTSRHEGVRVSDLVK